MSEHDASRRPEPHAQVSGEPGRAPDHAVAGTALVSPLSTNGSAYRPAGRAPASAGARSASRAVGAHADGFDTAIVGGGIVGLATARALVERFPGERLVVLEKESEVAAHQTGHNSGVIHSGIYYKPGSHKARLCVEGARLMQEFCAARGIRVDRVGKVIVATREDELPRLAVLQERAIANGVPVEMIGPDRLRDIEPNAAAIRALWSPSTAIVDYREVAVALASELTSAGVTVRMNARVLGLARGPAGLTLTTASGPVRARRLVNCAGLYSDRVARMAGERVDLQIIPFRGEYYMLRPERHDLVRGLIYPVPDPSFPFLGVHLTRTVHGEVEAGPNAVLAFGREGYTFGRVHLGELAETVAYAGFWNMARRYWRTGSYEMVRSLSKRSFVRAAQRLLPALNPKDVIRGGAGVRAQAVNPDGTMVDDFRIVVGADAVHVLNAPSPAATASLAIGIHIAGLAVEAFAR